MAIKRDKNGRFIKGNSYWLGRNDKKPNKGCFKKGSTPHNKGLRTYKKCERCGKLFSTNKGKLTKPHQRFCSASCRSWKNGNTPIMHRIWNSSKAKKWREEVRKKFENKCCQCGETKNLHCHHIKEQKKYPELRFDINNGLLLCFNCHKKTDNYAKK